ncbi:MAG TPA: extensin family protein [Kofleriaceae bacterium]|nr:extensin family protein [Kofleriaceae bacterium]
MAGKAGTALIALVACATSATAKPPKQTKHAKSRFETPADADAMPAVRYGAMSADDCIAELGTRQIPFTRETAKGVLVPVRLAGPLHGVTFKTDLSDAQRATTPWEIGDCRLVLAMDDFAQILAKHDIVEVRHYSMYRVPPKSWPDDRIGIEHNGGLALDAARFTKSDGTKLVVLDDFHGAIGDATCGDEAKPRRATDKATELRAILCEAVADHLFNVVLTPNFNKPHRNHFHLEVMANKKWFLVH